MRRQKGNLYWVTDSYYQAMFLTTREGVVVVDAPPTIGHNILRVIEDVTRANGQPSKVTHLVYSHSHADHIGASSICGRKVIRVGHSERRRLLRIAADPNRPAPTETFDDRHVLTVGGERLQLAYHGPNHTPDNIFVYAPRQATLMVVDVLLPGWALFKNLAMSEDIPSWIKAHDIALDYPCWASARMPSPRRGTSDLDAGVRAAAAALDPTPYFEKYGPSGNAWAIFRSYLDAVVQRAAAPVIAKYADALAAADVFTVDNAYTLLESLRINSDVLGPFGIRS